MINLDIFSSESVRISRVGTVKFSIDNIFSTELAENLNATFPNSLLAERLGDGLYSNINLNEDSPEVSEFFRQNPEWNEYRELVRSKLFVENCLAVLSHDLRNRYSKLWQFILGGRATSTKHIFTTMQATMSRRGFIMSPHSDDKYALVSMIHYFPVNSSSAQLTGGTRFFKPKTDSLRTKDIRKFTEWGRGLRRILPFWLAIGFEGSVSRNKYGGAINKTEISAFNELFVESNYFTYESNKMIGFVKDSFSFHEVDLLAFPENEFRCAVLVNLRLRPSKISILYDRIINKLDRIIERRTDLN